MVCDTADGAGASQSGHGLALVILSSDIGPEEKMSPFDSFSQVRNTPVLLSIQAPVPSGPLSGPSPGFAEMLDSHFFWWSNFQFETSVK